MNLGLKNEEILASINQYLSESDKNRGRVPEDRYTSFDYCYNYFYSFYKKGVHAELKNRDEQQYKQYLFQCKACDHMGPIDEVHRRRV